MGFLEKLRFWTKPKDEEQRQALLPWLSFLLVYCGILMGIALALMVV